MHRGPRTAATGPRPNRREGRHEERGAAASGWLVAAVWEARIAVPIAAPAPRERLSRRSKPERAPAANDPARGRASDAARSTSKRHRPNDPATGRRRPSANVGSSPEPCSKPADHRIKLSNKNRLRLSAGPRPGTGSPPRRASRPGSGSKRQPGSSRCRRPAPSHAERGCGRRYRRHAASSP